MEEASKFICNNAMIFSSDESLPQLIRFSVTNFDSFWAAIDPEQNADAQHVYAKNYLFNANRQEFHIQPVQGHHELINELKALKSIDVTCILSMTLETHADVPSAQLTADNICSLLTLARGTHITWLNFSLETKEGTLTRELLRYVRTKPFESDPIISPFSTDATARILDRGLANIDSADKDWNFREALNLYIDGKATGDSIRSRALKTVICLEIVRSAYIARRINRDTILPRAQFELFQTEAKQYIIALLRSIPGLEVLADEDLDNKLSNFNRPSFRSLLQEMTQELDYFIEPDRLARFVKTRNHLVHQGMFPEAFGTDEQQLEFLQDLVGHLLLDTLGYYSSKS